MSDMFQGAVKRSDKEIRTAIDNFQHVWNTWIDRRNKYTHNMKNTETRHFFGIFKSNQWDDMISKTRYEPGLIESLRKTGYMSEEEYDFWDNNLGFLDYNKDICEELRDLYTKNESVYINPEKNKFVKKFSKRVDIPREYVTIAI